MSRNCRWRLTIWSLVPCAGRWHSRSLLFSSTRDINVYTTLAMGFRFPELQTDTLSYTHTHTHLNTHTNSLRLFPPAGGCGPSGPKLHATEPASSRLQLALSTRPGTPTWTLIPPPHPKSVLH